MNTGFSRRPESQRASLPSVAFILFIAAVALPRGAEAEETSPGVAGSGMSQGSGAITTRSDVTLSVESLPGTSALRLGAIGEAIGTQMEQIRACYVEVIEQTPTITGGIQVRINIPERGRGSITLEVASDTTANQALTACVLNAIRRAPLSRVPGPSGGLIVMQFTNTAAQGTALVAQEQRQAVAAVRDVDGHPQASGGTPAGEIRLTVAATNQTTAQAVGTLFQNAQARIGMMLDCRRRASRREANPEGEIVLNFRVPPRGNATGNRVSSTVADPNAPQCVLQSLQQSIRGQSGAAGTFRVTVRFAPR